MDCTSFHIQWLWTYRVPDKPLSPPEENPQVCGGFSQFLPCCLPADLFYLNSPDAAERNTLLIDCNVCPFFPIRIALFSASNVTL